MQNPNFLTNPVQPGDINKSTVYPSTTSVDEVDRELSTARLEFDVKDMRRFIKDRGINVLWERAYFCPCLNPTTGSPLLTCSRCQGKGIAYLPARETVMAIQSQAKGVSNTDIGLLDSGTALGTTILDSRVSYRDRFTVPEVLVPQSLLYYISEDRSKKGIPLYYDVKEVTFITSNIGDVTEEDYHITNGRLYMSSKFIDSTVSLNIYMTLRYVVSDILKESRYQYTKFNKANPEFNNLPQLLVLKREDVIVLQDPYMVEDGIPTDIEVKIEDPKAKTNADLSGFFGGAFN